MKNMENNISTELLAAFIDGHTMASENMEILSALEHDSELRETLRISREVDEELGMIIPEAEYLPMTAMAASCGEENYCCLECEKYILTKCGIPFEESKLMSTALLNKWQKEKGTALFNIGRHLENCGMTVSRRYQCSLDDIVDALEDGYEIIAVVDGGELTGDINYELKEDVLFGPIPDHSVVVISCNDEFITIYDPDSPHAEDRYPMRRFADAWADSMNYLVIINHNNMNTYKPHPIDLSDVVLTEDLNELREAIAENAHEIWAEKRQCEGWTYGPQRDDKLKQTPDMVPYSKLTDSEKRYDREMAMQTIKLLKKLGYDLIKREDTELYRILKERIASSEQEYFCSCGNVIYKHQVFCDKCGKFLNMDWREK